MGSADEAEWVEAVEETDLFYDDRTETLYRVVAVSSDGLTLQRGDSEYYIPHESFAEWYDPGRVTHNQEIPIDLADQLEVRESTEDLQSVVSPTRMRKAADRDEHVYVRREALRDAERHGTAEYVPAVVEKVWTQGVTRVHSPQTRRTYLVDLDDVRLPLTA